jgi:putative transposase
MNNNFTYQLKYHRHLPHIQPQGATLFITFRLADSIPLAVREKLRQEKAQIEARLRRLTDPAERTRVAYREQRRLFGKWDQALDCNRRGPHWLRRPDVAQLVVDELHRLDKQHYLMDAFCVMPNHVHLVFTPLTDENGQYYALSRLMQTIKGRTAIQANQCLHRRGQFWQHESYDHVVRDDAEWRRIVQYVLNNPVKAGLISCWEDWPWTYLSNQPTIVGQTKV